MWRAITEDDLLQKMTEAELSAVSNVVYDVMTTVTDMVRGYVASSGAEMDEDPTTIPDRLIGSACAIILVDAYISLGGTLVDPKGHRKDAKDEALQRLRDVAAGKFSVDDPVTGVEQSVDGGVSVVGRRSPRVTRDTMRGL
ncbi:hypothetical protein EGM51_10645 [Verrucomicrobia bacterium S94]|nr:hypothetical protein EGM51_10645 [Verrucomicrobia bacterium S94]